MTDEENVSKEGEERQKANFSHEELVRLTKETVNDIVESDPLLSCLPLDVTTEEIKSQIAVAQGQAITLYLNREELPRLPVIVPPHNTTVGGLKRAIKLHMNLCLKREKVRKKISWKHIWKKYNLAFEGIPLTDDKTNIKTYGIVNKSEVHFTKKRREKNKVR